MSAQSWSVKGIDPKIREAAREAAARKGMSLAEYLNHALTGEAAAAAAVGASIPPRGRALRYAAPNIEDDGDDDWQINSGARASEPTRLTQRVESIERRTQLALTGLDRAVSAIDRSVLGLAARIEDAEALSGDAADRIAHALEQFRLAGETLSGRVERAENESAESRRVVDDVQHRLESQVSMAGEVARRAEAAASYIAAEIDNRDAAAAQTLAEARDAAERAAEQARSASADAVRELRQLQTQLTEQLAASESSTRRSIENAVSEIRNEAIKEVRASVEEQLASIGGFEQFKADQTTLISRIERAEANARESTAGLRQAAGAAIADLRNAQLGLTSRLKQIEDIAGGGIDTSGFQQAQRDVAERLAALEAKTDARPMAEALAAFEARIAGAEAAGGAVASLDNALQRLAQRITETESTANNAIRTLEETVSSIGARVEHNAAAQETEALRAMLEQRLDNMAQSVTQMVDGARSELAGRLQSAIEGIAGEGLEGALADVNRRLAAAERRQAQTIEAISLEIKRMSESVDKRLRTVEARNDDAAASAVREELSRMASTLEQRFDDIERREAAAFDRMGIEVGRLSERLEERVGAVETRSAQAIEQVGEQVARTAERLTMRHDTLSRELGERMMNTEERSSARVSDAISSIMQRLAEAEERSAEAIAPVQKAVSSIASKLERIESKDEPLDPEPMMVLPASVRESGAFTTFGSDLSDQESASYNTPIDYSTPMDAAPPTRAAPLPPQPADPEASIYYSESLDDILVSEQAAPRTQTDASVDDLLVEEAAAPETAAIEPTAIEEPSLETSSFWQPEETNDSTLPPEAPSDLFGALPEHEPLIMQELTAPEPSRPPSRHDYLANARKAAQAQSLPRARNEPGPAPRLSLRGSSRVVLWGAASVVAAMLVGGAWYATHQGQPDPAADPESRSDANAAAPDVMSDAPIDPGASLPSEGAAPGEPVALMDGIEPVSAIVAGPLAPRAVSLEQAAQAGDLAAQYELALQQIAAGRAQEGVTLMRRAADRGFPMAQYRLAKLYERGEGVPVDLVQARQWTERAAAAGNRRAMHDLGVYFARGEGAPLDEAAAFRWFRQAAELGVADSQYNLGVLYQQGRGVNPSASEALFWFLVAGRQGDTDAAERATSLESQLPAIQVQQARARAQSFRPRAASALANGEFGPRPWAREGA